ncbi:MAG: NADH-quinone oxidoreductase subunit NuoE [Ornithinimicrobium sp.]|uniref:NADH-quinone oxidoreductase subunit NuoE n=1 Tax=Ornithinimicrobium sp. TaxID=1977084 RepID=UPI003D9B123E
MSSDTRTQLEQETHNTGPLHHHTPLQPSDEPYPDQVLDQLKADAALVIARYPQPRSALLPLLHLVQSVDGHITGRGVSFCADQLDLTTAEVSGVATFYTQYKRHPNGQYTVGVCTNTLCAIMGGDQIFDEVSEHLGIGHDEMTPDGAVTLERVECNAACDYAPVVMVNWEFFDDQTPESTKDLVDKLVACHEVVPTRGASSVCTFKQMSRVLAGFTDGRADEGVGAGGPSLVGLQIAKERGWVAPVGTRYPYTDRAAPGTERPTEFDTAAADGSTEPKPGQYDSVDTDTNDPDKLPGGTQAPASDDGEEKRR